MALVDQVVKTPAEFAADQIREQAIQGLRILENLQKMGIRTLWRNPNATAQEICDVLDTDASQAFFAHGALTTAIVQVRSVLGGTPNIDLPTNAFVDNPDGTVTVSNDPYVPPQ